MASVSLLNLRLSQLIAQKENISYVINISGRQRMLSQNIAKTSLLLLSEPEQSLRTSQLDSLRKLFEYAHQELLRTNKLFKSSKIDHKFIDIQSSYSDLLEVSGQILLNRKKINSKNDLLVAESLFLPKMDQIVKEYELLGVQGIESINRNVRLSYYIIGFMILLSIGLVCYITLKIVNQYSVELAAKSTALDRAKIETERAIIKGRFAYVASHDLQEPIRTILSLTEMLSERHNEKLDEEGSQIVQFIHESGERMTKQIRGLLDYSRLGKDQILQEVDLNIVMEEVQKDLQNQINDSHTKIKYDKLPVVVGYQVELRSLFQNLLSNAIKFRKESESPVISIKVTDGSKQWMFKVEDNGIGIDSKYFDKIFQMFQRLNKRENYEGIGIGLAVCQHIVELHHGKIWVESKLGKGSTFYFTLNKYLS